MTRSCVVDSLVVVVVVVVFVGLVGAGVGLDGGVRGQRFGDRLDDRLVVDFLVRVVVVAGLELDADVERLGGLAVARPHQFEVAHEAADGGSGQSLGPWLVTDLVVEGRDLGHQVRLGARVDGLDEEPPRARGQQVVPAIRVAAGLADLGERADARERRHASCPDVAPILDQHDTERAAGLEAVSGEGAIALLEDVQGDDDPGAEHRVEREQRDVHASPESSPR